MLREQYDRIVREHTIEVNAKPDLEGPTAWMVYTTRCRTCDLQLGEPLRLSDGEVRTSTLGQVLIRCHVTANAQKHFLDKLLELDVEIIMQDDTAWPVLVDKEGREA